MAREWASLLLLAALALAGPAASSRLQGAKHHKAYVAIPTDDDLPVVFTPPGPPPEILYVPFNGSTATQLDEGTVHIDRDDYLVLLSTHALDVWLLPDNTSFVSCDFSNATLVADFSNTSVAYLSVSYAEAGDVFYAAKKPFLNASATSAVAGAAAGAAAGNATGCEQGLKVHVHVDEEFFQLGPPGAAQTTPPPAPSGAAPRLQSAVRLTIATLTAAAAAFALVL